MQRILALSPLFLATALASADIGFPAAVDLSRGAVPQGTLLGVQLRNRDNVWGYEGDLYDAALTTNWGPRFHQDTGDLIGIGVDSPDSSNISNLQAIFARLETATIDFADAQTTANAASARTDVERIQFDLEAGILAFQVEYFDGVTKIYIDSVTGGVIPHFNKGEEVEQTIPGATMISAVALAESTLGAGWHAFQTEAELEDAGATVEVLLFNLKSGMLAQAEVLGETVIVTEFTPSDAQASMVWELQANWAAVLTGIDGALAAAEVAYPLAGINEVELEIETEKTGPTISWRVGLVTADLIEVDYFVDATTPAGSGFRFATAPINGLAGDLNQDGIVNAVDLTELLGSWSAVNPLLDLDGSGTVDAGDLTIILNNWSV